MPGDTILVPYNTPGKTGVIDQNVDVTECGADIGRKLSDGTLVGDVELQGNDFRRSQCTQLSGYFVQAGQTAGA